MSTTQNCEFWRLTEDYCVYPPDTLSNNTIGHPLSDTPIPHPPIGNPYWTPTSDSISYWTPSNLHPLLDTLPWLTITKVDTYLRGTLGFATCPIRYVRVLYLHTRFAALLHLLRVIFDTVSLLVQNATFEFATYILGAHLRDCQLYLPGTLTSSIEGEVITSRYHVSKISGSQETVVLQIW